jgi:hypothetical protein
MDTVDSQILDGGRRKGLLIPLYIECVVGATIDE